MRRLVPAIVTLLLTTAFAACGSDEPSGADTTVRASGDAAPAGESDDSSAPGSSVVVDPPSTADDTDATSISAPQVTTESIGTTELTEPSDPTGTIDSTNVDSSEPDTSTGDTSTDDTSTDVTVIDITPEGTDLPPVPTGADVTPELCATLTPIHEWFVEFDSLQEDTSTWEDVQSFDAARTGAVLEHYEELGALVPELDETATTAMTFIRRISEIIKTADSFDEASEMLFGDPEDEEAFAEAMEQGLAVEAIDDYAVTECVGEVDDTDTEGTTVSTDS